jgi:hypothetical protein
MNDALRIGPVLLSTGRLRSASHGSGPLSMMTLPSGKFTAASAKISSRCIFLDCLRFAVLQSGPIGSAQSARYSYLLPIFNVYPERYASFVNEPGVPIPNVQKGKTTLFHKCRAIANLLPK